VNDKKEIMLEMYRPHIKEERWEEFKREIERTVKEAGPVTKIDVEYYVKNREIRKINFLFGNGKKTYILEPWRVLLCAGNWQKEYPEEYERIIGLLSEAKRADVYPIPYIAGKSKMRMRKVAARR